MDTKMYRQGTRAINQTFYRLRLLVLIALTTGMRMSEIFALTWSDVPYREGLIPVRSKLKGDKFRYVPMTSELATETPSTSLRSWERIAFSRQGQARKVSVREVEGSFETVLELADIRGFCFHDLRHSFASWYMMNGGDLYELARILGHSNIKMTERYAKLAAGA